MQPEAEEEQAPASDLMSALKASLEAVRKHGGDESDSGAKPRKAAKKAPSRKRAPSKHSGGDKPSGGSRRPPVRRKKD